jgi:hypothetical protein
MRDDLRTDDYWEKIIKLLNHDIKLSQNRVEKAVREKGCEFKGTKIAYIIKQSNDMALLRALYSSGAPIEEIATLFPAVMETFVNSWSREAGCVDMTWMLSIGIMLDTDKDMLRQLGALIVREDFGDRLWDFLLHSVDPSWEIRHTHFNAPVLYGALEQVMKAPSKDEAASRLKQYLENEWYAGHRDCSWYNSHKDSKAFYEGYWSFESGAIAKILGLDDTGWETMKYYPYDMVHYKE